MIEIIFNPEEYRLTISGHANYKREGEDIVCAGVSTLVHTLYGSLQQAEEMIENGSLRCEMEKGRTVISCKAKPEFEGNIGLIYWTILNGFQMVAERSPEYVTLKA